MMERLMEKLLHLLALTRLLRIPENEFQQI